MKRESFIILSTVVVITVLIPIIVIINKIRSNQPIENLTPKRISQLQNYEYYQKQPKLGFGEIDKNRPNMHKWIYDTFFEEVYVFDDNEKFITNESLTYYSWNNHFVIRGVLQTLLENGDITEQNMEYEFMKGSSLGESPEIFFVGERKLGDERIIKRSE